MREIVDTNVHLLFLAPSLNLDHRQRHTETTTDADTDIDTDTDIKICIYIYMYTQIKKSIHVPKCLYKNNVKICMFSSQ